MTDETRTISLSRGLVAIVDACDYERLAASRWHASTPRPGQTPYARRHLSGSTRMIHMHREVLGVLGQVDHINGNGLDNRRSNLRSATASQNAANSRGRIQRIPKTSRYRGVSFDRTHGVWTAHIQIQSTQRHLGNFRFEIDAAKAYDEAARAAFGGYARPNFEGSPHAS